MNLLEHYIEEVISVTEYIPKTIPTDKKWVEVKMLVNCYGTIEETTQLMPVDEWEKVKKQGYYMA